MDNNRPLLPVKEDFIFKKIFGDQLNADILADFLKSVLDIPKDDYDQITIIDPHVKKEHERDKYSVVDIKLNTKSGDIIHIEIQIWPIPQFKHRTIYQQSKMIAEQIAAGQDWAKIKRVVSIIITDRNIINGSGHYHHQFRQRTTNGVEFTDLIETNTLELSKLPKESDASELWYWLKFIKSDNLDDKEVLDMIAERSVATKKAIGVLKELSADERTRMIMERQEIERRDRAAILQYARSEGILEGIREGILEGSNERALQIARNALEMDMDIEATAKLTGLSPNEIENIKNQMSQN